jgi:hypothetical protein
MANDSLTSFSQLLLLSLFNLIVSNIFLSYLLTYVHFLVFGFCIELNLVRVVIFELLDLLNQFDCSRLDVLKELNRVFIVVLLSNVAERLLDLSKQRITINALLLLLGAMLGRDLLREH